MSGPVNPRAAAFVAGAAVLATILAVWAFAGIPNSGPNCPTQVAAHGRVYCAEVITLQRNSGGPGGGAIVWCAGSSFQGVAFELLLGSDGNLTDTAMLGGTANESGSVCSSFGLTGDPLGPPVVNWTSPDGIVFVQWKAPFQTMFDGGIVANITCGVYLGE